MFFTGISVLIIGALLVSLFLVQLVESPLETAVAATPLPLAILYLMSFPLLIAGFVITLFGYGEGIEESKN